MGERDSAELYRCEQCELEICPANEK